ncbi:MAG: TolC family protein, partial [Candidatus Riflebacteria bacterium]|nr:TolC family protein [Candidatus Riflebacteria bacterium]
MRRTTTWMVLGLVTMGLGFMTWVSRSRAEESLAPLPLSEAVGIALVNNPTVGSARASTRVAQIRLRQTAATWLPTLNYSFTEQRNFTRGTTKVTQEDASVLRVPQRDYGTLERSNFGLAQLIYDFQRTTNQIRAARHEFKATRFSEDVRRAQTILDVHLAYVSVLLAQRLLRIARETTAHRQELLEHVIKLFKGGLRAKFDVSRAQVDYKSARLAEVSAEAAIAKSRFELNAALGVPYLPDRPLVDILDTPPRFKNPELVVQHALARRPETQAATARVRAAKATLRSAKATYLPRVTGTGTYAHTDGTAGPGDEWLVAMEASVPLFDLGQTRLQVQMEQAHLKQNQEDLRAQQNSVVLEVRQRLVDVEEGRARIEEARGLVEQAQENLDLARQRYEAGLGRIIDVTDAQLNWTNSRQALDRAKADLHSAIARVERAAHLYPPEYFPRKKKEPAAPAAVGPELDHQPDPPTLRTVRALGGTLSRPPGPV